MINKLPKLILSITLGIFSLSYSLHAMETAHITAEEEAPAQKLYTTLHAVESINTTTQDNETEELLSDANYEDIQSAMTTEEYEKALAKLKRDECVGKVLSVGCLGAGAITLLGVPLLMCYLSGRCF